MRVHHLSCGTMCPVPAPLFYRRDTPAEARHLVCHCLLIETERDGLVLVDTGFGAADIAGDPPRIPLFFRMMNRPTLRHDQRAISQLRALGFAPEDVRHIVLTHLDFDHAGGIEDFPWASIHVLRREREAARERRGFIGRHRYRPRQWDLAALRWQPYESERGEPWFGFGAVRALVGLPPELLILPLPGHTLGHAGVAVQLSDGWILHAGDAYFDCLEMRPTKPDCVIGRRFYQWMMEADRRARLQNQDRLRQLVLHHANEVQIFCSHDPTEFLAAQTSSPVPAAQPAAFMPHPSP